EPGLGGGVSASPAHPPDAGGGRRNEREHGAYDRGESGGIAVRPALGEQLAEFAEGSRLLLDQRPAGGDDRLGVQTYPMPAEAALRATLDDRLHQGTKRQAVAGGDQMDGRAHQRDTYHLPIDERLGQPLRLE